MVPASAVGRDEAGMMLIALECSEASNRLFHSSGGSAFDILVNIV